MKKKIYCLAEMAFQFDLKTDLKGGGERVLDDFVSLLKRNDYDVYLYQFSHEKKMVNFRGNKIQGIGNVSPQGLNNSGYNAGLDYFYEQAEKGNADGIYLLSMNLSSRTSKIPTITVSHGIMFNHCEKYHGINIHNSLESFKRWVRNATHTISCDTDSMHLMSVYYPDNIKKMSYVPNYVNLNLFKPKERKEDGVFRVLYPRRLQHARGYHVLMEASDVLLEKYDNIEIIFAGKGNAGETQHLNKWMITKGDRVKHVVYEPHEMPKAYENIDVGLVPTCYSEGTSLSLLEIIASGIIPITTWVGGLSDIVQPNVNGIVMPPNNSAELVRSIEYVMENKEHVEEMKENGQNMIKHFSKERWDNDILNIVKAIYG